MNVQRPPRAAMSDAMFSDIAAFAKREAGLHLPASKKAFVYSRVQKRLRAKKVGSFSAYQDILKRSDTAGTAERLALISVLTTNFTQFFREEHHFDILREELLPPLVKRAKKGEKIRIWSAGCSAGQEPYSILLTCLRAAPALADADFRILATDIDPVVLNTAHQGVYETHHLAPEWRDAFPDLLIAKGEKHIEFAKKLRQFITFRHLNLLSDWPFQGKFDAIFCRNVAIYFDQEVQKTLFCGLAGRLKPEARLFIGHSERAPTDLTPRLAPCGLTTYRLAEGT